MGLPVRSLVWLCQDPQQHCGTAHSAACALPVRFGVRGVGGVRFVASRSRSLGDGAARALGVTAVPVAGEPLTLFDKYVGIVGQLDSSWTDHSDDL